MSTLHVMADARGRWRVFDDDEEEQAALSDFTTADAAERAAWRRGAGSVLVHDRYGRIHFKAGHRHHPGPIARP